MPRHKLPTHKLATAPRAGRVVALLTAVFGVIAVLTLLMPHSSAPRSARTVALDHPSLSARSSSWQVAAHWRHHHVSPSPSPSSSAPVTAPSSPTSGPSPTTPPTISPTPTPSSPQTTPSASAQPNGVSGNWSLKFDDEFNGTSLGTNWNAFNGGGIYNNVYMYSSNVSEGNGVMGVKLASNTNGGFACTTNVAGDCQVTPSTGWALPVGGFAEARINFPGSGTTIYNWPAFWACQMQAGRCNNSAGEIDIAEGLGTLTVNYHSPTANTGYGTVPGTWAGGFHTYGVYRASNHTDLVYYDGALVKTVTTSDNGGPEDLILEASEASGRTQQIPSAIQVDYVRGWTGAPS